MKSYRTRITIQMKLLRWYYFHAILFICNVKLETCGRLRSEKFSQAILYAVLPWSFDPSFHSKI